MSKTIELSVPIIIKEDGIEKEIKSLTFKRIKLKHLRLLPKKIFDNKGKNADLTIDEIIPLIVGLTGLDEKYVDDIDLNDFGKIGEELGNLLEGSL